MRQTKREAQREQTYRNIIEAAEVLFADHGIAAVSLRQIGMEAGSLNTNAVGYYVGTKEELVEAIFRYRIPQLESGRAQYLAELERQGLGRDLMGLLKAIWMPLYKLKDKRGQHSYARFLLNVDRAGLSGTRIALDPSFPVATDLFQRVSKALKQINVGYFGFVLRLQLTIVAGALEFIDENQLDETASDRLFNQSLNMLYAALASQSSPAAEHPTGSSR